MGGFPLPTKSESFGKSQIQLAFSRVTLKTGWFPAIRFQKFWSFFKFSAVGSRNMDILSNLERMEKQARLQQPARDSAGCRTWGLINRSDEHGGCPFPKKRVYTG